MQPHQQNDHAGSLSTTGLTPWSLGGLQWQPCFPVNDAGPSDEAIKMEAARSVTFGVTEGRYGSFCKEAAVGQPSDRRQC